MIKTLLALVLVMKLFGDEYELVLDSHLQKIKEIPIKSWMYVDDFAFIEHEGELLCVFYANHYYMDSDASIRKSIRNSLCRENAMRLYQFRLPTKTRCLFSPDVNETYAFVKR